MEIVLPALETPSRTWRRGGANLLFFERIKHESHENRRPVDSCDVVYREPLSRSDDVTRCEGRIDRIQCNGGGIGHLDRHRQPDRLQRGRGSCHGSVSHRGDRDRRSAGQQRVPDLRLDRGNHVWAGPALSELPCTRQGHGACRAGPASSGAPVRRTQPRVPDHV